MAYTVDYGVPSDEMNLTTAQDGKIFSSIAYFVIFRQAGLIQL